MTQPGHLISLLFDDRLHVFLRICQRAVRVCELSSRFYKHDDPCFLHLPGYKVNQPVPTFPAYIWGPLNSQWRVRRPDCLRPIVRGKQNEATSVVSTGRPTNFAILRHQTSSTRSVSRPEYLHRNPTLPQPIPAKMSSSGPSTLTLTTNPNTGAGTSTLTSSFYLRTFFPTLLSLHVAGPSY